MSLGKSDLDVLELTEHPVLNELGRATEITRGTLLATDLEDDIVLLDRRHDRLSLGEGMGHGLLAVDVLLVVGRLNAALGMPVIRSRDTDSIDVFTPQELLEMAVALAVLALVAFVDLVLRMVHIVLVDIANGDDLNIFVANEGAHVAAADAADPDVSDDNPLTGSDSAAQSEGAPGYEVGSGDR